MTDNLSTYFSSLHNLKISNEPVFELEKGLYLTIDNHIKQQVLGKNSVGVLGFLEYKSIFDIPVLAFAISDKKLNPKTEKNALETFIFKLHMFNHCLWLVKDNSVYKQISFLKYGRNNDCFHSNYIAHINSTSNGIGQVIHFNTIELEKAKSFFPRLLEIQTNDSTHLNTELTEKSTRISRAFYYLQGARMNKEIGIKITLYCTALESLFIDNGKRIYQNLINRVAEFLTANTEDYNFIRSKVARAYDLRSKTIHGNILDSEEYNRQTEKIINTSKDIDLIVREVLLKILESNSLTEKFNSNKTYAN
ncbi:hypothetical protein ACFSTE_05035 [Aquimarina hainanensis]|uniref:Apea-like HEPN domain-containing protein n=2 Tax=Aquimarina hainanensis TaxID=1578017 RepID=A0ABW5N3U5_9FLAO